jgi:hypothetical protein
MKGCNQMSNNNYATTTNGLPIIYRDFESTAGSHIDSVLEELKEFAEEKNKQYNDRVFIYTTYFNGCAINSSMTVDEVYNKLFGHTKAEMEQKRKDMDRVLEKLGQEEKSKSIQTIEGLYPKLTEQQKANFDELDWRNKIDKSIYHGREFAVSLQFVDLFNQQSYDDAVKLFKEEGFSGASLGLVEAIIHKIDKAHFYQFSEIAESA